MEGPPPSRRSEWLSREPILVNQINSILLLNEIHLGPCGVLRHSSTQKWRLSGKSSEHTPQYFFILYNNVLIPRPLHAAYNGM
jgi:hypothetical protein